MAPDSSTVLVLLIQHESIHVHCGPCSRVLSQAPRDLCQLSRWLCQFAPQLGCEVLDLLEGGPPPVEAMRHYHVPLLVEGQLLPGDDLRGACCVEQWHHHLATT